MFILSVAYAFLNQPARAVPDFDKAIEYKSTDPLVFVSRAWMLWKLKQYDRMLADCNKAIEMDPKCEGAYVFRACFYIYKNNPTVDNSSRLDTSQFPLAIADLNKAIELKPDYIDAYLARSFLYEKLGNKQQAQADLARARELGYNK